MIMVISLVDVDFNQGCPESSQPPCQSTSYRRMTPAMIPQISVVSVIKIGVNSLPLRIPRLSGRVFQLEAGHHSGMKPATIPE
jgi:hypothetical protein